MPDVIGVPFMTTKAQYEDLIARQTVALQSQMARIAELEADVARLNAALWNEGNALGVLQKVYSDPNSPLSAQLKAAGIAVGYEMPRPPQTNHLYVDDFVARLAAARRGEVIDVTPDDEAADTAG
jgi:hypothetical protein